jgi:hypothetical protein
MEFKVGDKIRGISDDYWYTNKDMYLGEVKAILKYGIKIKILKHRDSTRVGIEYFAEYPNGKFEIVELTKSELQSKIDKLENINKKLYSKTISNRDKIVHLKREIMSLKEENKQILDNAEKRYLENVIRPFRDRVISVIKNNDFGEDYIKIDLNNGDTASLPNFVKNTMYKGMRSEKKYTLKELGLFEEDK